MNKLPVGILAIQGGYEAHAKVLCSLNTPFLYVTLPTHLYKTSALIIPGGESTTLLKFITENGLFEAIINFKQQGHPIFGTCAGAVLMAHTVKNPDQPALQLMDIVIERNAYGRQLASCIKFGKFIPNQEEMEMVFIRAPKIKAINKTVEILAQYDEEIVCVKQANCIAATFHPELSISSPLHIYFLSLI